MRTHLGLDIPDEPECDYPVYAVINTFYLASRSRQYVGGMVAAHLPLGVADISNVVFAHPVALERDLLDACVFALDNVYLEEITSKAKEESTEDEV